jgi:hypothetical protein
MPPVYASLTVAYKLDADVTETCLQVEYQRQPTFVVAEP